MYRSLKSNSAILALPIYLLMLVFAAPSYSQADAELSDKANWAVSASQNSASASLAIDALPGSRWTSRQTQRPGQTFTVNLNASHAINKITMLTKSGNASDDDHPRGYQVHLSTNGNDWGTAVATGSGNAVGTTNIEFTPQAASYIRITQTGSDGDHWWSIHDLKIFETTSVIPAAIAVDRSAWVTSASNNGGQAGNAIDANTITRWTTGVSQSPNQTFTVDMAQAQTIAQIEMVTKSGNISDDDHPRGYQVHLSNNGSEWGDPVASGAGSVDGITTIDLANLSARYIRITQTGSDSYHWWSIHDLNVYASDVQTNVPPTATFAFPAPNAEFSIGEDIAVTVNASDADGSVSNVRLYIDDVFIRQENVIPYEWDSSLARDAQLANLSVGTYELRAQVTDNEGQIANITTSFSVGGTPVTGCSVSGDQQQWHRVVLSCEGPQGSEADDGTFTDNRFNVTFSNGARSMIVPGHFAADGGAADNGASTGNLWRAYFSPPQTGDWNYSVSFRSGSNIAVNTGANAGTPVSGIDGASGSFNVSGAGTPGRDMRTRGLLEHLDGERYMRFAGDDSVFIQGGMDSPENIFGYDEFDDTVKFSDASSCKGILHSFDPHEADWQTGDPTWGSNRGQSLIGLVNYIASKGVNSAYIMMNTVRGDGCDAHPWSSYNADGTVKSFDVSKLDQWERVLGHMTAKGILIHVMTQETENDQLLNGGDLGLERQLYYRELISRFGHHPALQWNLGEENTNTAAQETDFANFIRATDPYDHPIYMHTFPGQHSTKYEPLLGLESFDGPTLQYGAIPDSATAGVYGDTLSWINQSTNAGKPWVVTVTEASGNNAPTPFSDVTSRQRVFWMWSNVMAGGGGFEWYLKNNGSGHAYDLAVEDLREFDQHWEQSGHVVRFFRDVLQQDNGIDLQDLSSDNTVVNSGSAWVLSQTGQNYVVFLHSGGSVNVDLAGNGAYEVLWFNPRTGQSSDGGIVQSGGSLTPPSNVSEDWAVLLTLNPDLSNLHPDIVRLADIPLSDITQTPGANWADSYSVGDRCYCATTFDHNIGPIVVDTDIGPMTVFEACELLGEGPFPGGEGRPVYNDVQCGNGPANDAGDEDFCPGRVDLQKTGCTHIGPTWNFTAE